VGSVSSGERGTLTTAVWCVNASSNYVPSMLIFIRARGKDEIKDGAPPSSGNGTWRRSYTSVSSWTHNTHSPAIGRVIFQAPYFLLHRRNGEMVTF
jgi:hypothetical protein